MSSWMKDQVGFLFQKWLLGTGSEFSSNRRGPGLRSEVSLSAK